MTVLMETKVVGKASIGDVQSNIHYPSYKSFDEFIDIEHLRSLNHYISNKIKRRIQQTSDSYFLNEHRLDESSPYAPGAREIWLSRTRAGTPYNYLDLDRPEPCGQDACVRDEQPTNSIFKDLFSAPCFRPTADHRSLTTVGGPLASLDQSGMIRNSN